MSKDDKEVLTIVGAFSGVIVVGGLIGFQIGARQEPKVNPVEWGSVTASILCEKFGGLKSVREDSESRREFLGDYIIERATRADCKDGSSVKRSLYRIIDK